MPADPPPPHAYTPASDPKLVLQAKKMDLEAGWLGKIVGGPKNAPNNITFMVLVLVLLTGLLGSVVSPADRVELWKVLAPIVTGVIGFLFGRSTSAS